MSLGLQETAGSAEKIGRPRPRLMIVEDEFIVAADLSNRLAKMGYNVIDRVALGEEAIVKAFELDPDLILMDIILAGELDGINTALKIRQRLDLPIVFLTGHADEDKLERVKLAEPYGYLVKPFNNKELRVAIEMALYKYRLEKQRLAVQAALKEAEETARVLLNSNTDGAMLLDTDLNVLAVNDRVLQHLGVSRQDMLGRPAGSYLPPEIAQFHNDQARKAIETRQVVHFEEQYGRQINFFVFTPILDDQGRVTRLAVAARDITESRRAEEALRASKEKYQLLMDNVQDGIAVIQDFQIVFCNAQAEAGLGFSLDELKALPLMNFFNSQDQPLVQQKYHRRVKGEFPDKRFEYPIRTRDGQSKWIRGSAVAIEWEGRPALLIFAGDVSREKLAEETLKKAHDELETRVKERTALLEAANRQLTEEIAERKRFEEALRQSEEMAQSIINATSDFVLLFDRSLNLIACNDSLVRLMGRGKPELFGRRVIDYLPPELAKARDAVAQEAIEAGMPVQWEDEQNGQILTHNCHPIFDQSGQVVRLAVFTRDITKRKKQEQALMEKEKVLERQAENLAEANTTLKYLLELRYNEKAEIESNLNSTLKRLVWPYLEKLKTCRLTRDQQAFYDIITTNLAQITGSATRRLVSPELGLTQIELEVAQLIREGRKSKEIAELLQISTNTIAFHRKNIRTKLGLSHQKISLATYLMSLE